MLVYSSLHHEHRGMNLCGKKKKGGGGGGEEDEKREKENRKR